MLQPHRVELVVQANLSAPLWAVVHNVPVLYANLVERLGAFGVGLGDLRSESGDGSLGGFSLSFWAFNVSVLCRIRLAGVEVACGDLSRVGDLERLDALTQAVLDSTLASQEGASIANYTATVSVHGALSGVESSEYLGRFTANVPAGLGPAAGSGASFYFGASGPRTYTSVVVDQSAIYPGSLYLRVHTILEGAQMPKEQLKNQIEEFFNTALSALDLEPPTDVGAQ